MARSKLGRCVHCRQNVDSLTRDHVLPEAWYPDSTPKGMQKWQVPSCQPCNASLGKFERDVFQKLALGVDPATVGGEGIGEKALRSFDPRAAKSPSDLRHRQAGKEKARRRLRTVSNVSFGSPVFPNIGTIYTPAQGGHLVSEIGLDEIERLVTKFVNGISYLATGCVLPDEYTVRVIDPGLYSQIPSESLASVPTIFERGPGFRVERHGADGDQYVALFHIYLWGKYEFFAAIVKERRDAFSAPRAF